MMYSKQTLSKPIIGIAGMSRSGKTTLAKALQKHLVAKIKVLHLDNFVFEEARIPQMELNGEIRLDWEHPLSIDFNALYHAIHRAELEFDCVIVEGFLLFYEPSIRRLFSKKIIIQVGFDLYWERRKASYSPPEPDWYIQYVWDAYQFYHKNLEHGENTLILQAMEEDNLEKCLNFIEK